MEDIRLAVGLISLISIAAFAVTYRLLKQRSQVFLTLAAMIVVGLIVFYMLTVWGQLWIVKWIPLPSVIVLSNWFPPLLGVLSAIVWLQMKKQTVWRRMPITLVMLFAALGSLAWYIPDEPPVCADEWFPAGYGITWPVCQQTTDFTCSAAAAATILGTIDVKTTEQEMSKLCLTKSGSGKFPSLGGTTWLGLYHGLSSKLLGTKHRVEFFEGDLSVLKKTAKVHPVLLCCELNRQIAENNPEFENVGGWRPGVAHTVIYFRPHGDNAHLIGDPSRGFEVISNQDLDVVWTGEGLKIAHYDKDGKRIP